MCLGVGYRMEVLVMCVDPIANFVLQRIILETRSPEQVLIHRGYMMGGGGRRGVEEGVEPV